MSSCEFSFLPNFPILETFKHYWNYLISNFSKSPSLISENSGILTYFENVPLAIQFDDFQYKLLKCFSIFLFVNIVLICISWKIYGNRISERFMKPATSKAIEELKASVSKLKLPKEHTPRI